MNSEQHAAANQSVRYQIFAELRVDKQRLEQFAIEATDGVRQGEPGTLSYLWHIDGGSKGCMIEEEYADSDAFRKHMSQFRESGRMRELGGLLRVERILVISGEPDTLREAFAPLETVFYETVAAL
jgi:quinol monooxygenase YgiN